MSLLKKRPFAIPMFYLYRGAEGDRTAELSVVGSDCRRDSVVVIGNMDLRDMSSLKAGERHKTSAAASSFIDGCHEA